MSRRGRVLGWATLVVLVIAALGLWRGLNHGAAPVRSASAPAAVEPEAPPPPPRLQSRRVASAEKPLLAHEELLTVEGDGAADISALADITRTYLQQPGGEGRDPLGFNEDLARALTNRDVLGEAAIPTGHPALRDGQLIDRWGTPWHVHPLAGDLIELRSAGPDRKLFTADDLVAP